MQEHQELVGRQRAMDLSVAALHASKRIARLEPYRPAGDFRRVAVSVPPEIAGVMGNSRYSGGLNPES
jgi:hypothetical protein